MLNISLVWFLLGKKKSEFNSNIMYNNSRAEFILENSSKIKIEIC